MKYISRNYVFATGISGLGAVVALLISEAHSFYKYQLPPLSRILGNEKYEAHEFDIYLEILLGSLNTVFALCLVFVPVTLLIVGTYGVYIHKKLSALGKATLVNIEIAAIIPVILFVLLVTNNRMENYILFCTNAVFAALLFHIALPKIGQKLNNQRLAMRKDARQL